MDGSFPRNVFTPQKGDLPSPELRPQGRERRRSTMKNTTLLCLACLLAMAALMAQAQDGTNKEAPAYEGREHIQIDHEAMKSMTREERRAAMQAYKTAREDEARRAGAVPSSKKSVTKLETPRKVVEKAGVRLPGSNITYDTGTVFGGAGVASQMLGNRFDSALNPAGTSCCFPVETSGSITMITFDMVATFFGSAVWSLYSDIMGNTAVQVTSMARPGIMTGLNTLSVMSPTTANAYMNGTFLAGIWQFSPAMTGLAIDTGSTGGQGFHGISLNDGAVGTGLTTVTTGGMGVNAVFRVSGDVATPVELMSFEIEDN